MTAERQVEIDGRAVRLTSLDRVLWPRAGFTKGDLVDYYLGVAPALVPHLAGRALTLGRFPSGVDAHGFAQTECRGAPKWMTTAELPLRSGEVRRYCVVDDAASLAWVANLGTIELHPFLALAARPDEPTAVVFDLDPGAGAGMAECREVALELRTALAARRLESFAKTSGSAGVHVLVPVGPGHPYARTKPFARAVAEELAAARPDLVTAASRRGERRGRVLVDWLQNDRGRSTVAAYSPRATDRPSVSTPVTWDEVERASRLDFDAGDVLRRVERIGDPLGGALDSGQRLP